MVSRTPYNSDRVLSATAWASAIASLDTAVIAELDMSKTYNAGTRTVTIQISAKYLKEASAEHQLVIICRRRQCNKLAKILCAMQPNRWQC